MGLLKKYFMHRRGGLICPPERIASAQTKSYTIQFMGTKTKWRKRLQLCGTVL